MKCVLSIAGSDSSGGAGIQADIKTVTAHGMFAMTAIAALTAQNTLGVQDILEVPADFVGKQLDSVFTDIRPDAVKIGMLANADIIAVVAQKLRQYQAPNIVLDPVMVSTSGSDLLQSQAVATLREQLFALATVITPNIPEAEVLCGFTLRNDADIERAAKLIAQGALGASQKEPPAVLIKGGHLAEQRGRGTDVDKVDNGTVPLSTFKVDKGTVPLSTFDGSGQRNRPLVHTQPVKDLLYHNNQYLWFESPYIANLNTHGTGCTLSSAIACNLAMGLSLSTSIQNAKRYLSDALAANLNLGSGKGPLNHMPYFSAE